MLPLENKPWAKSVATTVIAVTVLFCVIGLIYLNEIKMLHTSEIVIAIVLLLTVIPPNIHVLRLKPGQPESLSTAERLRSARAQEHHAR